MNTPQYPQRDNPADETQVLRPVVPQYQPPAQGPVPDRPVRPAAGRAPTPEPKLFAGRFDQNKTITNLAVMAVLAAVITGAAVRVVDVVVSAVGEVGELGTPFSVVYAIVAALAVALAGMLYIPVVGTDNENLYSWGIIALTIAAVALWGVFSGLLDGQWEVIVTMVAIALVGGFAFAAPSRVDRAADQTRRY